MHKPVVFNVAGEIGQLIASVAQDGEELRQLITKTLKTEKPVILDFADIDQITLSFLNAGIGMLYDLFDVSFLEKNLKCINLTPSGETLLRSVKEMSGNYLKNHPAV